MADEEQIIADLRRIIMEHACLGPFGPVTEERLRAAELELGLTFPLSYRLYLREFGAAGDILDLYIYGLPNTRDSDRDQPTYLNLIDKTQTWRDHLADQYPPEFQPLKPHLIDIGLHCGGGSWFYIDTSKVDETGEAPVLIYGHGIPLQVFASSFVAFLRKFSDEEEPFAQVVKNPPQNRQSPVVGEVKDEAQSRRVTWLKGDADPAAPPMPPNALFLGLDVATRDVFVHAKTMGLDMMQQLDAMETGDCMFGNPSERGQSSDPYVTVDYLARHHPDIFHAYQLANLKQTVLDVFDREESGMG